MHLLSAKVLPRSRGRMWNTEWMAALYACNSHRMQHGWCPLELCKWVTLNLQILKRFLAYVPLCVCQDGQGYAVVTNILKNLSGLKHPRFIFHSCHVSCEGQRWPCSLESTQEPRILGAVSWHILSQSSWQREVSTAMCHTGNRLFLEVMFIISA